MTTNKNFTLPVVGSTSPNWGELLNNDFSAVDKAFGSFVEVSGITGTVALTTDQVQNMCLKTNTSSFTGNVTFVIPAGVAGQWVVMNQSGASNFTLSVSSGTSGSNSLPVDRGITRSIYCDGSNVFYADAVFAATGSAGQVAYSNGTSVTGSSYLLFDGATLSIGSGPAAITGWTVGAGTFTVTFSSTVDVPDGSYIYLNGVTTSPASPNLFNAAFPVQSASAGSVTFSGTVGALGGNPTGGTISYGNLKLGGTPVRVSATEVNLLSGRTAVSSQNVSENRTAGVTTSAISDGLKSSGTYTPSLVDGNMRDITNGGAFTLAAPTDAGSYTMVIKITNVTGAGLVTFSGFDKTQGSPFTTTVGNVFLVYITVLNGTQFANVVAMQ
jgi:hypothetical protein